jgi:SAM-dependent methyltransferase
MNLESAPATMQAKTMCEESSVDDIEVKRVNILHHNIEAEFFEQVHPEGSSIYERSKVLESMLFIFENSTNKALCIDIGCGTGFATSFELPIYKTVVATDISRGMLEVLREKHGNFDSLNLLVCDAEFLPLRSEIADLVSVSSVLHHLPKPFNSLMEISRLLRPDGFLYVIREPNLQRFRRFFDFLDQKMIRRLVELLEFRSGVDSGQLSPAMLKGLDFNMVDIHFSTGFQLAQVTDFLRSRSFNIISAYSYHWVFPRYNKGMLQELLTRSNFSIEKFPLSKKLGRYLSVVARKTG